MPGPESNIKIGEQEIKEGNKPYIIAEVGVNHEGVLQNAFRMIDLALEGGANAVKFQSYKAESLASRNSPSYWDLSKEPTRSQYQLFKKYDAFGSREYSLLAEHCRQVGIDFLSTPFDLEAVDFLDPLMPCFKVASADITNIPLMRKIASKGKPVLLSTGASTLDEIREAVDLLQQSGCAQVALLHCVLNYPTRIENANLGMIDGLKTAFPNLVLGYSDHTIPDDAMTVLSAAYLMGALIIEKHFTFDKSLPGNDHYHAMDVQDLKQFNKQFGVLRALLGTTEKMPLPSEQPARMHARRSLVIAKALRKGEEIQPEILTCKRPGTGIGAINYDEIIGMVAAKDLEEDHVLSWGDLKRDRVGNEKVTAIIQARMGSTRFPGKMMVELVGIRIIDWVLSRVTRALRVDEVVLALPAGLQDDVLEEAARGYNVTVIRGSEQDVLHRFVKAARLTKTDVIVRVCADNPFIAPEEVDRLVDFFRKEQPDYAFNHLNRMGNNYPDGFGTEILSRSILEEVDVKCTCIDQREHVTKYIWDNQGDYRILTFPAPKEIAFPEVKLDVDTRDDLAGLETWLRRFLEMTGWQESPLLIKPVDLLSFYQKG